MFSSCRSSSKPLLSQQGGEDRHGRLEGSSAHSRRQGPLWTHRLNPRPSKMQAGWEHRCWLVRRQQRPWCYRSAPRLPSVSMSVCGA
jgi:hypothetical protein